MNIRLRNRKSAEHRLQSFLAHIIIPPGLADLLCNGDVDARYLLGGANPRCEAPLRVREVRLSAASSSAAPVAARPSGNR